jgi:hypothetical protein
MSPGVAAAIALPLGALAIAVMLYGVTKLTPQNPGAITRGLFWGSLLTALMTTVSAIGLGADTQINFKKLNSKQQDERRKATYALAAVALITAGTAAALGIKYSNTTITNVDGAEQTVNPLWNLSAVKPDLSEVNVKSTVNKGVLFLIAGSGVTGLGLAIDKGVNGKKRAPAEQKKRDIAMGVLLAISGVAILSGAAIKKQDDIKAAFANKYVNVRKALNAEGATFENVKLTIPANAPPALQNAQNLNAIKSALNALSLKGRAVAAAGAARTAIGAGLTKTATLFRKPDQSLSYARIGSAGLLIASIIILAVLKSQKKLKPAPKPGKPAPGEIVMYVMISLSVLIFFGSYAKEKFFPGTPAVAPEAPEAPEVPETGGEQPTFGSRLKGMFKRQAAPAPVDYTAVRAALGATNANANREALKTAIAALPEGNMIKQAYGRIAEPNTATLNNLRASLPLARTV